MNDYVIYDIECFAHDAMVVFQDTEGNEVGYWHNDFTGLHDFIKNKILVGYNNYYYDDHILTKMLYGWAPEQLKELNDRIIKGEAFVKHVHKDIKSLDCFQQISVVRPSLKKIEGNMGKTILESSIPFDIDRPLTDSEVQEVYEYCSYDVKMTGEIFKKRYHSYFKTKMDLVEMIPAKRMRDTTYRWNTTTISANVLLESPLRQWSTLRVPDHLFDLVPPSVSDMWHKANGFGDDIGKGTATVREFDNDIVFGFGGLHSENVVRKRFSNVVLWDVTSMYPNIIIALDVLGAHTEPYKEILEERTRIKKTDKQRSDTLKLVLNSVYGNLKNKYSMLLNPRAAISVCVYGQIALYELGKRLSNYGEIVQLNTDGVAFIPHSEAYKTVKEPWEKEFKLSLEEDRFKSWIQRDVNNYIAVTEDDYVVTKGGDVGRYHASDMHLFNNNSTRIIDICIVEKLLYNKDVVENLLERLDDPTLFQYILQAGKAYLGTFDEDGKQYNNINRVFAAKGGGVKLMKKRQDGGLVRFPSAPDNMLVWNYENDKLFGFDEVVDLNHYYKLISKRLEAWL